MNPLQAILSLCRHRRRKVVRPVQPAVSVEPRTFLESLTVSPCAAAIPAIRRMNEQMDEVVEQTFTGKVLPPVITGDACGFSELEVMECERRERQES